MACGAGWVDPKRCRRSGLTLPPHSMLTPAREIVMFSAILSLNIEPRKYSPTRISSLAR